MTQKMSAESDSQIAGRELDALIAERVFGEAVEWMGGDPFYKSIQDGWVASHRIADYSTSIAGAWLVVERLQSEGWGHRHLVYSAAADNPAREWTFMQPGKRDRSVTSASAETIPLAICLAALSARSPLEAEKKEGK